MSNPPIAIPADAFYRIATWVEDIEPVAHSETAHTPSKRTGDRSEQETTKGPEASHSKQEDKNLERGRPTRQNQR